jgi:flagellar basal-body rod modification protein FlgD
LTSPVSSTGYTPISQVAAPATPAGNGPATSAGSLGQDAFLKLLVAQLKYQDPSNPSDGTQFLTQTATFTQVEKLDQLVTEQRNMLAAQNVLSASNMVGKTIAFPGPDGTSLYGVVTSATISGSNPTLRVGDMDVPLSSVTEVTNTPGPGSTA